MKIIIDFIVKRLFVSNNKILQKSLLNWSCVLPASTCMSLSFRGGGGGEYTSHTKPYGEGSFTRLEVSSNLHLWSPHYAYDSHFFGPVRKTIHSL